jgi:hypothetical protein
MPVQLDKFLFMGLMALFILAGVVFLTWRYIKYQRKHSHSGTEAGGGEAGGTKKRVSAFSKMRAKKEERARRQQELV